MTVAQSRMMSIRYIKTSPSPCGDDDGAPAGLAAEANNELAASSLTMLPIVLEWIDDFHHPVLFSNLLLCKSMGAVKGRNCLGVFEDRSPIVSWMEVLK